MSRTPDMRERADIVDELASGDEEVRRGAVERLALLPADEGLPLLVEQLGDPSWRVRKAAAERIAGSPEVWRVTPALIAAANCDMGDSLSMPASINR